MLLRIVIPVWGRSYCDFFLRYALPTLFPSTALTDGHPLITDVELHIYSTLKDWDYIRSSAELALLLKHARVRLCFREIESDFENSFLALTWCHEHAITADSADDVAFFFSNADSVFAQGAIDRCLYLATQGYRAVMTAGLRTRKKTLIRTLEQGRHQEDGSIRISSRDLVSVCLKNLHPISQAHISTEEGNHSLGHYYWPLQDGSLLARCFHVHPLFLWPEIKKVKFSTTVDHELVRLAVPDEKKIWLVQDSDDIFACEGSDEGHLSEIITASIISPHEVVDWASIWTNRLHRGFAQRSIIFRVSDNPDIAVVRNKADALINTYLTLLSKKFNGTIPDGMGLFEKKIGGSIMQKNSVKSLLRSVLTRTGRVMTAPVGQEIGARLEKFNWQFERINARLGQLQTAGGLTSPGSHVNAASYPSDQEMIPASARFQENESVPDPSLRPPPGYTLSRGRAIYREAFNRCIEFVWGNQLRGDILEFGTFRGYSARIIAELMVEYELNGDLYLYDSFQGLPNISSSTDGKSYEVAVTQAWLPGAMAVDKTLPEHLRHVLGQILNKPIHLYEGFFEDTLPKHLPVGPAALVHVDCDLYQSARTVLDSLLDRKILQDGTVICFDDYNCNRANPDMGERRAAIDSFSKSDQFALTPWFSYGWHGQAMFVHDKTAAANITEYKSRP